MKLIVATTYSFRTNEKYFHALMMCVKLYLCHYTQKKEESIGILFFNYIHNTSVFEYCVP